MFLKAELHCYFCGHDLGDVTIPTLTRRPTADQLHAAYDATGRTAQPVWDQDPDRPLCPRCSGRLVLGLEVVRRHERVALRAAGQRV